MNASVYIPTKLEYVYQLVKIRIFRALPTSSGEITLQISGCELSRVTVPAEKLVLPEGVSIDSEGYFIHQGKRISLWDKIPVDLNAQIIAKLPHYTAKLPEIDISL